MRSEYWSIIVVLISFRLHSVHPQVESLKCNFIFTIQLQQYRYTCSLPSLNIPDDSSLNFTFHESVHVEGRYDVDVTRVEIYGGSVPFIITELFSTYTNIRFVTLSQSGLLRIQSDAFISALNLEYLTVYMNPLATIEENAFSGASKLYQVDLWSNSIDSFHEAAFDGHLNLRYLNIGSNNISELHPDTFQSLPNLTHIMLAFNQLQLIETRLFANNPLLQNINIYSNEINAIQRSFLDNFGDLLTLNLQLNICIDSLWTINESTTIEMIQTDLEACFENFVEPEPEVRRFIIEVRGPLILRYENGTEIISV